MADELFPVVIVDDEPPARAKIRHYLNAYPSFKVSGEAGSGAEAVAILSKRAPAVLFLDISLPDMSGFDVLGQTCLPPECSIVFATAYEEHALRAFEAQAADYLVKPISPERFARLMSRIERNLLDRKDALLGREVFRNKTSYTERLLCRTGNKSQVVSVQQVALIEAARNYVVVHTPSTTHIVRRTLESLESSLDPAMFIRISRSSLVNRAYIRAIQAISHGDHQIELTTGHQLIWTRKFHRHQQLP